MNKNTSDGWYDRGYLPHCDHREVPQMITFRLADSLPAHVLRRELARNDLTEPKRKRFERLLDNGYGSCILQRNDCAQIVIQTLKFYAKRDYRLLNWVVMPNHVHVAYDRPVIAMKKIIQAWKGYSSKEIKKILGTAGDGEALWQAGYHDRYVRDEKHLSRMTVYMLFNPVMAGLVEDPFDWPYSSIHDHVHRRNEILRWWRDFQEHKRPRPLS